MTKVGEFFRKHILFDALSFTSLALIIASFIVPPTGEISPSVLAAVGEIAGFASLYILLIAVEKGTKASVTHNNTTLTVGNNKVEEV